MVCGIHIKIMLGSKSNTNMLKPLFCNKQESYVIFYANVCTSLLFILLNIFAIVRFTDNLELLKSYFLINNL